MDVLEGKWKIIPGIVCIFQKAATKTAADHRIDGTLIEKLAENHQLYWSVTGDLLGARVSSYGGYLSYSIK